MITQLRTGLALACAGVMAAVPVLVSPAASAQLAGQQAGQQAGQSLTISVTKSGLRLKGTAGLRAGHVKLTVKGKPAPVAVMSFAPGYSVRGFAKDYAAANKGDMKALKRAIRRTTFYGGLMSGSSGSIVLPRAGTYTVAVMAGRVKAPTTFRVGSVKKSKAPSVDGTVVARTGMKWGGADHLPAKGTLQFKNAAKDAPHFLLMQQVEEGTTVEDVMAAFQSEDEPAWLLPAWTQTEVLSPGRKMTLAYDLPPGQYVLLCFFPDPKMKGMPHSMMGMVKMIHLG